MSLNTKRIVAIRELVTRFQREVLTLREEREVARRGHTSDVEGLLIGIIEVIDVIDQLIKNGEGGYLPKVGKLLRSVLKRHGVERCEFPDGLAAPGRVRVLETRSAPGMPAGKILELCRQGCLAGDRVLRPAEVITSSGSD